MDIKALVIIILAAAGIAFVIIRNYFESKTDDVEKEINKVNRKNRQIRASDNAPRKTEYNPENVKKTASKLSKKPVQFWRSLDENNKKIIIFICGMIIIAAVGFVTIMSATDYDYGMDRDYVYGELNIPDDYELTDYNVINDNIIIDKNGVSVWIEGFYEDTFVSDDPGDPIILFVVSNDTEKDLSVSFDVIGVNGCCSEAYQTTVDTAVSSYETTDATGYAFTGADLTVKEIVFSHMTITDENSGECIYGGTDEEYEKLFRFVTDSDEDIYTDPWDVKPIYDESEVKIYKADTMLCIENNSKHNFSVTARALPQNQKTEDTICEKMLLPYGYYMDFELSGEYNMFDMDEGRASFSFEFECKDAPSESFKTGSIK